MTDLGKEVFIFYSLLLIAYIAFREFKNKGCKAYLAAFTIPTAILLLNLI